MMKEAEPFDRVRKIGRNLAGVEEGTTYGSPALKLDGKMFACMAVHRSAEPGTLAVRIDFPQRDELLAADPSTYYLTDHYLNYPTVLVRLSRVHPDALKDLLRMAYEFARGERRRTRPRRRAGSPRRSK